MIKKGIKQLIAEAEKRSRGTLAAATLEDMGMENMLHLEGGYAEWKKAGGPTGLREKKTPA